MEDGGRPGWEKNSFACSDRSLPLCLLMLMKIIEQNYKLHFIICVAILSQLVWQSLVLIIPSVLFSFRNVIGWSREECLCPQILWIVRKRKRQREQASELCLYTLILAYLEEICLDLLKPPKANIRDRSKESHKPEGAFGQLSAVMLIASDSR